MNKDQVIKKEKWNGGEMEPSPGTAEAMRSESITNKEAEKAYDKKMRVV